MPPLRFLRSCVVRRARFRVCSIYRRPFGFGPISTPWRMSSRRRPSPSSIRSPSPSPSPSRRGRARARAGARARPPPPPPQRQRPSRARARDRAARRDDAAPAADADGAAPAGEADADGAAPGAASIAALARRDRRSRQRRSCCSPRAPRHGARRARASARCSCRPAAATRDYPRRAWCGSNSAKATAGPSPSPRPRRSARGGSRSPSAPCATPARRRRRRRAAAAAGDAPAEPAPRVPRANRPHRPSPPPTPDPTFARARAARYRAPFSHAARAPAKIPQVRGRARRDDAQGRGMRRSLHDFVWLRSAPRVARARSCRPSPPRRPRATARCSALRRARAPRRAPRHGGAQGVCARAAVGVRQVAGRVPPPRTPLHLQVRETSTPFRPPPPRRLSSRSKFSPAA